MKIRPVGIDLAKERVRHSWRGREGRVVVRKVLSRRRVLEFLANLPKCLVGMEACASAHYWAREIAKLGHEVRLIAPRFVKPYVKAHKNDASDAEAICEAVTRRSVRFVWPSCQRWSHRDARNQQARRSLFANPLRPRSARCSV